MDNLFKRLYEQELRWEFFKYFSNSLHEVYVDSERNCREMHCLQSRMCNPVTGAAVKIKDLEQIVKKIRNILSLCQ